MSTEIDQRVVEMKFDNRNFEKNVSTSMSTLEKFKRSLRFDGATKGIEEVNKAASKFELTPMEKAVDTIEVKFSTMSIVAIRAISKIVDAAMDAGTKLVKSLSVDNIAAGWEKYGDKTASVQTIMNATGKSIDEVNKYLDKLMWFSDETSYGFNDMTKAIAQMTSSGGDIEKLIPMVMGVANATAYAGKGASEFSRIMYNLNQSYGAGYLTYIDWKSVELAGAGSEQLKQVFIDTAVALDKIKEGEVTVSNFANTLSDKKWADTQVMEAAFGKFAEMTEKAYEMVQNKEVSTASEAYEILSKSYEGISITAAKAAQEAKTFQEAIDATKDAVSSGWMKTFELIFGNYKEAKALWTDLANGLYEVFAEGGNARNELLSGGLDSGLQKLLKNGVLSVSKFRDSLFDLAKTQGVLTDEQITEYGEDFEASLKKGWVTADMLKESLRSLSEEVRYYSDEQLLANGYTQAQIDDMHNLSAMIENVNISYEDLVEELQRDSGRENLVASLHNLWDALFLVDEETGKAIGIISVFKQALQEVFPALTAEGIYNFTVKLREFTQSLILTEDRADGLKNILKLLLKPIKWLIDLGKIGLGYVGQAIKYIGHLAGSVLEFFSDVTSLSGALSKLFAGKNADRAKRYKDSIERIQNAFRKLKETISSAFKSVKENEKVQNILTKFKDAFGDGIAWILEKTADLVEFVSGKDVIGFIKTAWSAIKGFFLEIKGLSFSQIIDLFIERLKSFFGLLRFKANDKIGGIISIIKEKIQEALPYLEKLKESLKEFFKSLTPGKILVFAFGIALISVIANISNLAKSLTGLVGTLSGLLKDIKNKFIKTISIANVALAITALTAALVTLSSVNPEGLKRATASLAIMAGVLTGMYIVLTVIASITKKTPQVAANIQAASIALLSISGAFLLLSASLWVLSKVDTTGIGPKIIGLMAVLLSAILACRGIAKIANGKEFREAAVGFVFISASLLLFVAALKSLAKVDSAKLVAATGSLLIVFTDMMLIALSSRVASFKGAAGLLVMAFSLTRFVKMLEKLTEVDPARIVSVMPQFIAIVVAMGALGIVARTAGKNAALGGVGILAMSASIYILVQAIQQLAGLSKGDIGKGAAVVGGLIVLFGVFSLLSKSVGGSDTFGGAVKLSLSIMAVAGAIWLLTGAIQKLGSISLGELAKGVGAVSILIGAFALLAKASSTSGKAALVMVSVIFVIGTLSSALALLTLLPANGLLSAAGALSAVLLSFATAMLVAQKGFEKINFGTLASMLLGFTVTLAAITLAFSFLPKDLKKEQIVAFGAGISAMILSFAGAAAILGTIKDAKGAAKGVLVLGLLISEIGLLVSAIGTLADPETIQKGIDILSKFEALGFVLAGATVLVGALTAIAKINAKEESLVNTLLTLAIVIAGITTITTLASLLDGNAISAGVENLKKLEGLWLVLIEMAAATAAVAGIAKIVGDSSMKAMLQVLAVMGIIIAAFTGLAIGLGALVTKTGIDSATIESGIDILVKIGEGIGRFYGALFGGLAAQSFSYLPEIANSIVGFINAFRSINGSILENLKTLAEAILIFTAASFLDGLNSLNILGKKKGLVDVGEELNEFAPLFGEFLQTISQYHFDPSKVNSAAEALKGISEMVSAMPRTGGLAGTILGDKQSLSTFGENAADFAKGLKQFFLELKGVTIDQDTVDSAVNAGKVLAGLQAAIPASGGKLQQFLGEHNWPEFNTNMVEFGKAIVEFCQIVKDIQTGDAEKAAAAGTALAKLQAAIPASGGKLQEFLGSHNWTVFNSEMVLFGRAIVAFCEEVSGKVSLTDAANAAASGMVLAKLNDAIPESGGILQGFLGEKDLGAFGDNLTSLGRGLSNFSLYLTNVKWEVFDKAVGGVNALAEIANQFDAEGGFLQIWTGETKGLDDFGAELIVLGEKLTGFYGSIENLNFEKLNEAIDALRRLATMGAAMANIETTGLSNFQTSLIILANGGLTEFTDYFKSSEVQEWLENSGNDIVYAVCRGINNIVGDQMGVSAVTAVNGFNTKFLSYTDDRVSSIATQFAFKYWTAVKDEEHQFNSIGSFAVQGIIAGIGDEWSNLMDYVRVKVAEMVNAFQIELSIQSPSKVMRDEVGKYIVMGIAEGISDDMSAEEAAAQKAKNIVDAFKTELDKADLTEETQNLEYQLWSLANPTSSNETKLLKQIERQNEKLKNQADKVMLAEAEYKATVLAVGEGTKESQEAYNKYLKEQITMREYTQELLELQAIQLETAVKREDLGHYVIENIAYGITTDMSAESAAEQKATNIVNAFKKVLDTLNMDIETSDLEYQVWEAANQSASSTEKMLKKIELLDKKLQSQAERTMTAEAEYKTTLSTFGENSDYTKEAYQKYLKEQLSMLELANEMAEYQDKPVYYRAIQLMESRATTGEALANDSSAFFAENENTAAMKIVRNYVKDVDVAIEGIGDATENVQDILDSLITSVDVDFEKVAETIETICNSITGATNTAASSVGELPEAYKSAISKIDGLVGSARSIIAEAATAFFSGDKAGSISILGTAWQYKNEALNVVNGLGEGFKAAAPQAVSTITSLGSDILNGLKGVFKSNSPSKAAMEIGEYFVIGLAQGFLNMLRYAIQNVNEVGDETLETMTGIVAKIDQVLSGDLDFEPVISPVLDLSGVYAGASQIGSMLDATGSYTMATNAHDANDNARIAHDDARAQMLVDNLGKRIDALQYSLDDLRAVVEARGHGDLNVEVDVDGAQLARMTVPDYINASRAAGTPFYTPSTK